MGLLNHQSRVCLGGSNTTVIVGFFGGYNTTVIVGFFGGYHITVIAGFWGDIILQL